MDLFFDQYRTARGYKESYLLNSLNVLTTKHYYSCQKYKNIIDNLYHSKLLYNNLEDVPYLPVSLFKEMSLHSIDTDKIFKTMHSSGTTSNQVSSIFLDKFTALNQSKALVSIVSEFIGPKRLPLILVDSETSVKDRYEFSARGAGLLGMKQFSSDHIYCLDDDMVLDEKKLVGFLSKHKNSPILIFGFTFMVWEYFLQASKIDIDLSTSVLFHSGGWKKLQDKQVSNLEFKKVFKEKFNLEKIHNFYGMVEQVGSIYVECEEGRLHSPNFSEIIIRDSSNWSVVEDGQKGIIQTLSVLPESYPGHSLVTEDLGRILERDDCLCGRLGTTFEILGRVPKIQIRGCSDV